MRNCVYLLKLQLLSLETEKQIIDSFYSKNRYHSYIIHVVAQKFRWSIAGLAEHFQIKGGGQNILIGESFHLELSIISRACVKNLKLREMSVL